MNNSEMPAPCPTDDLLLDYAAGRLDAPRASLVERHAAGCERCAALCESQLGIWQSLEDWKPSPVSEGFNRELWRKIDAEASAPASAFSGNIWFGYWKRFAPLAFAAGLLLAAYVFVNPVKQSGTQPVPATAPMVMTASDADQLERELDDMQLLNAVDTAPAKPAHEPDAKKTL